MFAKRIAIAAALGTGLVLAAPAFADPPHWASAHGWRAKHYRPHYVHRAPVVVYRAPAYAYVPPRPVVVVPPPRYYYYEPRPVIYGRVPLGRDVELGIRVGF
ncbi:MAG: hypothetical protein AB1452_10525 [Pseudomonadota bacterium]